MFFAYQKLGFHLTHSHLLCAFMKIQLNKMPISALSSTVLYKFKMDTLLIKEEVVNSYGITT